MPLAYFYSLDGSTVITLDAIGDLSSSLTASATSSPVQSGFKPTDHYVIDPVVRSISGVISDTKLNKDRNPLSQKAFESEVNSLIKSKKPFAFISERDGITSLPSVLILSFNTTAFSADGIQVSMTFREILIEDAAELVDFELRQPREGSAETTASNKDSGDGGTKEPTPEERAKTYARIANKFIGGLFSGGE